MFVMWLSGLFLMILAVFIFRHYYEKHGVPYEKFQFENSNEFGALAPKDFAEYKEFQKIEFKAEFLGLVYGKLVLYLFVAGMILFAIPTTKFIFRM